MYETICAYYFHLDTFFRQNVFDFLKYSNRG